MGMIGENGAGKTTTLKAILNMVCPNSGRIEMFEGNIWQHEKACKQEIGVVFGGVDFYEYKKISDITAVARRFYKHWDRKTYQYYLQMFDLDENKKVHELSSGMKVKYLIAMAMSHNARLLILDEPTSGIDPVAREELLRLFRKFVDDGTRSILFSTHITSDLDKCADSITYIKKGKVLASANKEDFINMFQNLRKPGEKELTLEEIMIRTERSDCYA